MKKQTFARTLQALAIAGVGGGERARYEGQRRRVEQVIRLAIEVTEFEQRSRPAAGGAA